MMKDQKGFTLVELLTTMGILATLAAIVVPAVGGTAEATRSAQVQQGAATVQDAVNEFFTDQTQGELLSATLVGVTTTVNGDAVASTTQVLSNRWPEKLIIERTEAADDAIYVDEFPTAGHKTDNVVVNVNIARKDGGEITGTKLLELFTAVDLDRLENDGYMAQVPTSAIETTTAGGHEFHSLLWLFKKSTEPGASGSNDARKVQVFKLDRIEVGEAGEVELTYTQVF